MTISNWWFSDRNRLRKQNEDLVKENDRLLEFLADPKLISVQVEQNAVEIQMRPREEIMRHLLVMLAHAIGDSKNYVECTFGPQGEGEAYVVTVRRYHGKTPGQVHDEQIEMLRHAIIEHPTRETSETAEAYDERIRNWWNNKIVSALDATKEKE